MQEYRNEVKEFFSEDEQLAAEVEFALKLAERTAEQEKEMEREMKNCTLTRAARSSAAQVLCIHTDCKFEGNAHGNAKNHNVYG